MLTLQIVLSAVVTSELVLSSQLRTAVATPAQRATARAVSFYGPYRKSGLSPAMSGVWGEAAVAVRHRHCRYLIFSHTRVRTLILPVKASGDGGVASIRRSPSNLYSRI